MGEEFSVTLDKEGAYVYKCSLHIGLGMVEAIVLGEGQPKNIDQIHNHRKTKGWSVEPFESLTWSLRQGWVKNS